VNFANFEIRMNIVKRGSNVNVKAYVMGDDEEQAQAIFDEVMSAYASAKPETIDMGITHSTEGTCIEGEYKFHESMSAAQQV
jgi:hypothetical protein